METLYAIRFKIKELVDVIDQNFDHKYLETETFYSEKGKPILFTDEKMARYYMTIYMQTETRAAAHRLSDIGMPPTFYSIGSPRISIDQKQEHAYIDSDDDKKPPMFEMFGEVIEASINRLIYRKGTR